MRYVENHRRQTHSRIVENASCGLRQKGAKGRSVTDLMKLAGPTHGGFYNHFVSRAALVGEAIAFAMDQMTERWKKLANGKTNGDRFEALIADCLGPRHRDILNTVARFQPWLPMSLDRARASGWPWLPN
jgi:TetR/AcrR family transcriptional repressor of nem operon